MNLNANYQRHQISLKELAGTLYTLLDSDYAHHVDYGETFRLLLADFFYGVDVPSTNPRLCVNDRILCWNHGVVLELPEHEGLALYHTLDHLFWIVSAVISDQALQSTMGYRHQPTDCFYQYLQADAVLVVFTPSTGVSLQGPVVYPLLATATVCADTLPPQIKAALTLDRLNNPTG